jgi:hypothetical protein
VLREHDMKVRGVLLKDRTGPRDEGPPMGDRRAFETDATASFFDHRVEEPQQRPDAVS